MTKPQWPHRIRVYGGRATHAAGMAAGFADPVTACGRTTGNGDEHQDENTPVTCQACIREMNR